MAYEGYIGRGGYTQDATKNLRGSGAEKEKERGGGDDKNVIRRFDNAV